MSNAVKDRLAICRPRGWTGRGDRYLRDAAQELRRLLLKAQQRELPENYRLNDEQLTDVSVLLVEFAEDLHNDAGLWRTVEERQKRLFGSPLPFLVSAGAEETLSGFDVRRVQYFFWGVWRQMYPHMAIRIDDPTLVILAGVAARFLEPRFQPIPRDSAVAKLVSTPAESLQETKIKLIWLGTCSYLFRTAFVGIMRETELQLELMIDAFIREHFSVWSGLNPIEMFPSVVTLKEEDRQDFLRWLDQPIGMFAIAARQDRNSVCESVDVRNVITGEETRVQVRDKEYPVKPGAMLHGRIVPWRGEWHWFGHQRVLPEDEVPAEQDLRDQLSASAMAWEHSAALAEKARARVQELTARFVARHGSDFVEVPNGPSAATEVYLILSGVPEDEARTQVASFVETERGAFLKPLWGVTTPVGLFANPIDGPEWTGYFDRLVSALSKRDVELTEDEVKTIFTVMSSMEISPEFIRKLVEKYGATAVYQTFLLPQDSPEWAVEFLMRYYKAPYYLKRIPHPFVCEFA